MIKKSLYPKTKRISDDFMLATVTEKLDGSNLCFINFHGTLYIAQRNYIYQWREIKMHTYIRSTLYGDLYPFLCKYADILEQEIYEGSVICGEWMSMGYINYNNSDIAHQFYMYAKARIDDDFNLYNIEYNQSLFHFVFNNQIIPEYIHKVPIVDTLKDISIETLDNLYDEYTQKVNRCVEGFVITLDNNIYKYVRHKKGKITPHKP